MTVARENKIVAILRNILFDYCVDKTLIKTIKQIASINGEPFANNKEVLDCIDIDFLSSNTPTMGGEITKYTTDRKITIERNFKYTIKYIGEKSQEKLTDIINKMCYSTNVHKKLKQHGLFIISIDDVQNASCIYGGTFYNQAVSEIQVAYKTEAIINETGD